jgi:tetratricopeptide (TPR) repeat protein/transcriptional regulator with XRE-family HTH domain
MDSPRHGLLAGSLLREWRERAGLTQEQLAGQAGLNVRTIRRLESGPANARPRRSSLRLLAAALNLNEAEQATLEAASRRTVALTSGAAVTDQLAPSAGVGPPSSAEPPQQLPAPPPVFTGRDSELADLDRVLGATAVVIIAIDGMAGIGKTALALHAAHQLAGHYPDGQLFLDLHGFTEGMAPVEPGDALDRVLRALDVPGQRIPENLDDRAALYRSRLAGRKVLVLLDNAASEAQVAPLLPGTQGCLVLVTSRRRLASLDHTHTLSLDVLQQRDAVALFSAAVGGKRLVNVPSETVTAVVELCGRLPLAIRIAAARLRSRPAWTAASLAEKLRGHRHGLTPFVAGQRSVTAALDLSFRDLDPPLQRAHRLLGLHPGADLDIYAAAALIDYPLGDAERVIDGLLDANLLQEPSPGRFRFHDLVRNHAASTAASEEPEAGRRAALGRMLDYYRHTTSIVMRVAYPHDRGDWSGVPPAHTPVPVMTDPDQAWTWLDAELPNLIASAQCAAEHGWPDHTCHLSSCLHRHLRIRCRYAEADTLHGLAIALARSVADPSSELDALNDLSSIRRLRGRHDEAVDGYTRALAIARAIGRPTGELRALNGLAHVHLMQSRYGPAAESFAMARDIARHNSDHGGELEAQLGIGWVHLAQSQPAAEEFERALVIARATGNRIGELPALTGLGHVHRLQGRYELATAEFEEGLALAHATGSRIAAPDALNGLGRIHRAQGRLDLAAVSYRQLLRLAREIGSRNFEFEALHGLGRLHHAAGQPEEALASHRSAHDIATGLGQAAEQARAHDGLAYAYHALGRREAAREHWRCALDILTRLRIDATEDAEATTESIRANLDRLSRVWSAAGP